jgi:hypothetical protein
LGKNPKIVETQEAHAHEYQYRPGDYVYGRGDHCVRFQANALAVRYYESCSPVKINVMPKFRAAAVAANTTQHRFAEPTQCVYWQNPELLRAAPMKEGFELMIPTNTKVASPISAEVPRMRATLFL